MRKTLLVGALCLTLLVGVALPAPIAHATDTPAANTGTTDSAATKTDQAKGAAENTQVSPATNSVEGYGSIMTTIMSLAAWMLGMAAITLDNAVYYTVVKAGTIISGSGGISAIGVTWSVLRDMGNILLIFGFIALGITTIIQVDWYGSATKMIPKLIIAAVFINFSLFASEVIIDAGNLFATQFYTQIQGGNPIGPVSYGSVSQEGISNKLMEQLGLQQIYGKALTNQDVYSSGNIWLIGAFGTILFLITTFVFFSLAFILVARFVILTLLIIVAPIGFAGLAVPKLNGLATQWWEKLVQQTITAPVLLLLLYVALRVITDTQFLRGFGGSQGADWLGFVGGATGSNLASTAAMLLSFFIAMGLLLAVTMTAQRMSAFGAGTAMKFGGLASFGLAAYGTSVAGRATLGMTGNLMASNRMKALARNNVFARGAVLAGKGLQSSTYDPRNIRGVSGALKAGGINAGKGASLTAKQAQDTQYGVKPIKKWFKESSDEYKKVGQEVDFKDAVAAQAQLEVLKGNGAISQAEYDTQSAANTDIIKQGVSKMSVKQLEETSGIKNGNTAFVNNLSPQQFESLMKSDKLTDGEKGKIKEARYADLSAAVKNNNLSGVGDSLKSLSKGELESLPPDLLKSSQVLDKLSDKQRDILTDSKELTTEQKQAVRDSSPVGKFESEFKVNPALAASKLGTLTADQIAKLSKETLKSFAVSTKLTRPMIVRLQEEKSKLSIDDINSIASGIKSGGNKEAQDYISSGPGAAFWS